MNTKDLEEYPKINKTLAILAGGKNTRMGGSPKAFLKYNNQLFIEQIIEAGRDYTETIIVANDVEAYQAFKLPIVSDYYKGRGALGGIHAALQIADCEYVMCVACDMPFVSRALLNFLGSMGEGYEIIIPHDGERLQPLCAVYKKSLIQDIEKALQNEEHKLQKFIKSRSYKEVDCSDWQRDCFYNINNPQEFEQLCKSNHSKNS